MATCSNIRVDKITFNIKPERLVENLLKIIFDVILEDSSMKHINTKNWLDHLHSYDTTPFEGLGHLVMADLENGVQYVTAIGTEMYGLTSLPNDSDFTDLETKLTQTRL